jgi:RNA polymerase sigma-70 factor (ECF subfamily)
MDEIFTRREMGSPLDSALQVSSHVLPVSESVASEIWRSWIAGRAHTFLLYARQQTQTEEDARDLLQEALFESWRRTTRGVPDNALVFATIRRRAVDHARAAGSRSQREAVWAGGEGEWFEPDPTRADTDRVLAAAVQELPEQLREVLTLRIWGELSFPEIARLTGAPVATATSRYRYALERLREILGPEMP